ncbi:MAG: hypothetical protein SVG88_06790 [Halobacteriales archaeon]|nr:hypothetical protein [Halobacteriales archaeon]
MREFLSNRSPLGLVGVFLLAVILWLLLRQLIGMIAFLFRAGLILIIAAVAVYAGYQLWTGWQRAG